MTEQNITFEERNERLKGLSPIIREAYGSTETGELLLKVFEARGLSKEVYKPYATAVGDVILGFYKREQLPELLVRELGTDRAMADAVAEDLSGFLSTLATTGDLEIEGQERDVGSERAEQTPEETGEATPITRAELETSFKNDSMGALGVADKHAVEEKQKGAPQQPVPVETQRVSPLERAAKNMSGDGEREAFGGPGPIPRYRKPLVDTPRIEDGRTPPEAPNVR